MAYAVTSQVINEFKEPFGSLLTGSFSETIRKLEEIIRKDKPPKIITVGDTVSRNLHEHGIVPQVSITDSLSMRKKAQSRLFSNKTAVYIKNPQGLITEQAIDAVEQALESPSNTQIIVEGEEDLLTLIAVLYAPENALVIYGQPHRGMVVVKVTTQKKAEAHAIWKAMKRIEMPN